MILVSTVLVYGSALFHQLVVKGWRDQEALPLAQEIRVYARQTDLKISVNTAQQYSDG